MDSKTNNSYLKKMYEILSGKKVVGIYYSDNYYLKKISEYIKGGGDVTVDDHMDINSTNPVQNKVITRTINDLDVPVKTSDLVNDGEDGSPFVDMDAVGDKEDKSNKITGWSSTPDNVHYPSEKLVKDSLDDLIVSVEQQTAPETGYASTYVVSQGGVALSPKINIPKDFLVKSVVVRVCEEEDVPIEGLDVGDKYIDFTINTKEGSSEEQHLYLAVKEFGCIGDDVTLVLENGIMSIKNGGVNTTQLKDGAVTYAKLSDGLVIDNLTTDDANKLLSAKQGKKLEDKKTNKDDIVDNLTTNDSTKMLSAKQGKVLDDKKIDKLDIVDDLVTADASKVLSANQGKVLNDLIGDAIIYINQ